VVLQCVQILPTPAPAAPERLEGGERLGMTLSGVLGREDEEVWNEERLLGGEGERWDEGNAAWACAVAKRRGVWGAEEYSEEHVEAGDSTNRMSDAVTARVSNMPDGTYARDAAPAAESNGRYASLVSSGHRMSFAPPGVPMSRGKSGNMRSLLRTEGVSWDG
jgi:hypothetical protein